jgi:SAM-dependent methyltransferase
MSKLPRRTYSKSSGFYLTAKSDLFEANDRLLSENEAHAARYKRQPRRIHCKLCQQALPVSMDFASHGISYVFCPACDHLNGAHDDTEAFTRGLYIEASGAEYAKDYLDPNYVARAEQIYIPKVDFLLAHLPPAVPQNMLDVGCGSGYFVFAALRAGLKARGVDVNRTMVEFGNAQISRLLGLRPLGFSEESGFLSSMLQADAAVISAIGVIEHLRQPAAFFDAFERSQARFLLYSVPMFSFSAMVEAVFPRVFPRQLSGGHTHLFTERSIDWLHRQRRLSVLAEWRFGTDVMDLYRSLRIELAKHGVSAMVVARLDQDFGMSVDKLQAVLDREHFCSEIHCLVERAG